MDLTSAQIGEHIRLLRKQRDWTLQELSQRCGVSLSALSKIEKGQVAATFDTLVKVARGLGLSFDAILEQMTAPQRDENGHTGGRLTVTRGGEAVKFSTGMYDYAVHAGGLRRKHMTPLLMRINARSVNEVTAWSSHVGEELIYVIAGTIAMHTQSYEPVVLVAGDSAYIDSGMPHLFLNVGEDQAVMASICYSSLPDSPGVIARALEASGVSLPDVLRPSPAPPDPATLLAVSTADD